MALRLLVVMPGHLSTSPRLLKIADACADAGYAVRVVSGSFMDWAAAADTRIAESRRWTWQRVEYRSTASRPTYVASGIRRRVAHQFLRSFGVVRAPWWAVTRAYSRVYDELRDVALSQPFDMVIGGSVGGLALVPEVARESAKPSLLDLEDLHTAESDAPDAPRQHASSARVLRHALKQVTVVTTASEPMADAYDREFGIRPTVVHNVFPLPPTYVAAPPSGALRLYWFSQTIGPGRGLEDAVDAVGHAGIDAVLTLRGVVAGDYARQLSDRARRRAPALRLVIEPPARPDDMIQLCEEHDVGLSLELSAPRSRDVCLSNKAFTYLPAGLPVAFSDTTAQRWLATQLGQAAVLYPAGDTRALAAHLARWADDRSALSAAKAAARRVACERWRWDHPLERGAVLGLIAKASA